jgi:putative SOS response-associated peptidase YedK
MAGLYERCFIDEKEVMSFTVITTESNKQLNFLVSEKVNNMFKRRL